jgi:hypothetical protein
MMAGDRNYVSTTLIGATHCSEHSAEASFMREDAVADPHIFDIFHAIRGDYFLTREQTSDNWLDTRHPGALVELNGAVHATVIGKRQRVHPTSLRRRYETVKPGLTIQQAVLGVYVQVREIGHSAPP